MMASYGGMPPMKLPCHVALPSALTNINTFFAITLNGVPIPPMPGNGGFSTDEPTVTFTTVLLFPTSSVIVTTVATRA